MQCMQHPSSRRGQGLQQLCCSGQPVGKLRTGSAQVDAYEEETDHIIPIYEQVFRQPTLYTVYTLGLYLPMLLSIA